MEWPEHPVNAAAQMKAELLEDMIDRKPGNARINLQLNMSIAEVITKGRKLDWVRHGDLNHRLRCRNNLDGLSIGRTQASAGIER